MTIARCAPFDDCAPRVWRVATGATRMPSAMATRDARRSAAQHGPMRQQSPVLRDVPDAAAEEHRVDAADVPAIDRHETALGLDHAVEAAQQRRLAGAAFADEREQGTRLDLHRHGRERRDSAVTMCHGAGREAGKCGDRDRGPAGYRRHRREHIARGSDRAGLHRRRSIHRAGARILRAAASIGQVTMCAPARLPMDTVADDLSPRRDCRAPDLDSRARSDRYRATSPPRDGFACGQPDFPGESRWEVGIVEATALHRRPARHRGDVGRDLPHR